MIDLIENRIVELAFSPWNKLPNQLKRIGLKVYLEEDGETLIIDGDNLRVGFSDVDPVTKAVLIATAYCGSTRFSTFFPNLLKKVDRRWKLNKL